MRRRGEEQGEAVRRTQCAAEVQLQRSVKARSRSSTMSRSSVKGDRCNSGSKIKELLAVSQWHRLDDNTTWLLSDRHRCEIGSVSRSIGYA